MELRSTWVDDFVGFFSPNAKARRLRGKAVSATYEDYFTKIGKKRKYEGASKGRRTSGWKTSSTSANQEILGSLATLRDRSRDLVRNNPYAAKGMDVIANNTVGAGIVSQIKHDTPRRQKQLSNLWMRWAETNAIDFDGQLNIFGFQRMIMRAVAESGEALVRIRVNKSNPELPYQLQILESDFLGSSLLGSKAENGNTIVQGIEFDSDGRRVAYHLFKEHPGGSVSVFGGTRSGETIRVPAEDILHIFRAERPGQVRGVPWLAPVMIRLRDLDEYEDAQLVRQKIAACFSVFVRDMEMPDEPSTDAAKEELGSRVEPGLIEHLGQGKTIELANPPTVENYAEYMRAMLTSIASGLGVTYESLTGDLANVNFSSGRMGWLEFQRNVDVWRWLLLMPQFMDPVGRLFVKMAKIVGVNPEGSGIVHTPPRREMIDPTKEVPAIIKSIRGGIMSQSEAVRQQGIDPDAHYLEMAADNKKLDELGLTLDSDPRKTNGQGAAQSTGTAATQ